MMSETGGRRALGVIAIVAGVVAGLGAGVVGRRATPTGPDPATLANATKALTERALPALLASAKNVEPEAAEAARAPELSAAFDNNVDAATFQDAFESEDWWKPFRGHGQATALFAHGRPLASLFLERPSPPTGALLQDAQSGRVASGFLKGEGRVYVSAAARVERSHNAAEAGAVVLVARPFGEDALAALAEPRGLALALSDGQRLMMVAGPASAQADLGALTGKETAAALVTASGLPAAPHLLAPGLWLWTMGLTPLPVTPAAVWPTYGLAAMAVVLFIVGIMLMLSGRASGSVATVEATPTPIDSGRLVQSGSTGSAMEPSASSSSAGLSAGPAPLASYPAASSSSLNSMGGFTATGLPAMGPAAAQAMQAATAANHTLGRYQLIDKIGEGGMAEVFRAALHGAEGFRRQIVVKRLHPTLATNRDVVDQFIDEARLQAGLSHSNIVPVLDFGRAEQDYFLALEYVPGRDLEKLVQRHMQVFGKPMDPAISCYVVNEVLSALAYAHNKTDKDGQPMELVHRDVSLGNVLISYAGEVKLSDFGIVKAGRRLSKTQVGMIKGNASFMAPEQARAERVDRRADIFSAGVVLWCCLTGQQLYQEENAFNQLVRAALGPGTSQFQKIEAMSLPMASIIMRALAVDPSGRYASATEFSRALRPMGMATRDDLGQLMQHLFAEEIRREPAS